MAAIDLRNVEANAVVIGPPGIGGVLQSVPLEAGKVLLGMPPGPPVAGAIGSSNGSVVVTPGAGGIDLTVSASVVDKPIASADHTLTVTTGASSVDLSVAASVRDKSIASADASVVVTTGASSVDLAVASSLRDKTITSADGSVILTTGASSVDLSVHGRKAILQFTTGAQTLAAVTSYYGVGYASLGELSAQWLLTPFKGIARNLYVSTDSGTTNVAPCVDTLRIMNSADTALSAIIAANSVVGSDTTHAVTIAKGTPLVMKSSDPGGYRHTATIEYEEIA